jgi:hypothetical protein
MHSKRTNTAQTLHSIESQIDSQIDNDEQDINA